MPGISALCDPQDFSRSLASVQALLPQDYDIPKIIQLCKLYPRADNWRCWQDYRGYSLILSPQGGARCQADSNLDLEIGNDAMIVADLYHKASLHKISNFSSWGFIIWAEKLADHTPILYLWLLGRDQRLRLAHFDGQQWLLNQSLLSQGLRVLRVLIKNFDVIDFSVIFNQNILESKPVRVTGIWATIWPPSQQLKLELYLNNKVLTEQLLSECGI